MNDGRVLIVTGASSGIGRALAERAVRSGDRVFATGRRGERLAELERIVGSATGAIATMALDLREPRAAERIVAAARAAFGRIDVLVNAAGAVAVGPISQQSDAAIDEQTAVHVRVPLALVREALADLRASRGQVVFFGSGVARIPVSTLGAYPPAKAAVRSLARIVRGELRPAGIAVTYVDPGAVATEFMTRAGFAGPPPALAASPETVARRVYEATHTRRPVVNAVPWQTFVVALGAALPALTDALLARAPQIVGGQVTEAPAVPAFAAPPVAATSNEPAPEPAREPDVPARARPEGLAAALDPIANRMRKFNLRDGFVASLLAVGNELDASEVALRWAGMPNKHERALTLDLLETLANAGYLERGEGDRYRVVRGAD